VTRRVVVQQETDASDVADFDAFDASARSRMDRHMDELRELVALPTVSAERRAVEETAEWVLERVRRLGARADALRVDDGPPTIVGEIGDGERTLLVYDHFDVQPADPVDEWSSDPFTLSERDGLLYGRGVADNKGNLLARLQALETYRETTGELPLRVRLLFEGEEEVGSEHLASFVARHGERLRADGCIWEAGYKDGAGRHVISLGLKGIAYFDVRVRGTGSDAHSSFATVLPNAAWRLVWALATLKSADDRILVDALMDHVAPVTDSDRRVLDELPFDEARWRSDWGVDELIGGGGMDLKIKHFLMPTCTICGLRAGYGGPGSKTVLPAVASAKLDFRLVPDLTPDLVHRLLRQHLDRRGFTDIEVAPLHGELPFRSSPDSDVARAAVAAGRAIYRETVTHPLLAGSGPMAQVCGTLQISGVGFGVGNATSRQHGPNENVARADYLDHIRCFARFIEAFAGHRLA
jgi:acetylornithine deacetylase/succinyl-diaminopimelate desuccinylase-like protein